ncbi:hypothetical protein IHQ56_10880 [Methylobacillus flagellatus]|uniref:hypothetical protein n=1 Tax=Methylobacillus flagellatus TaxID=405 RepID=UPI002853D9C0|nr:hypothetical protein [Methylobacillus flagellatus]MDR5172324.1 hypothetical protein [Methylobacillus flagellatus]
MLLNLNVPALVDHPLIVAETKPAKITKFLNALPVTNILETSQALQEELETFNRQKVAPDTRIKALETYRPAIASVTESLAAHYCNAPLPLPEQDKQYATLANTLWTELAYGYKLALLDLEARLFKIGGAKLLNLCLHRTLDALRMQIEIYYETYRAQPPSLWSELHQLYALSVKRGLEATAIDDLVRNQTLPISHVYKQALLISLADPQHLSQKDIKLTSDYITRFAGLAQLQRPEPMENPAAIFLISGNRDKPPVPLGKRLRKVDEEHDFFLLTMDLARQVHQHIKQCQQGSFPPEAGLPENANQPRYQDLLTYLLRHWGASPKRIYNRTPKNDGIELIIGLPALHTTLYGKILTEADNAPGKLPRNSRWQALNISAGGMALRKLPATEAHLHIGDLVGIRISHTTHWAIGMLRWASHTENRHLDIGIQLLAPEAKPVSMQSADEHAVPLLLLPEIPTLKQSPSLIGAPGSYSPAKIIDLTLEDGSSKRIMITRLIERTNQFDHFQFSTL